jgi:hypothetical protein
MFSHNSFGSMSWKGTHTHTNTHTHTHTHTTHKHTHTLFEKITEF